MRKIDYPSVGETLYTDVLPNGLKLSVMTKPGYTRRFAYFAADYGGADRRFSVDGRFIDTPGGVAHFLEHKMFDMPDGADALSLLAESGAQPNAYTSDGITAYYFDCTEDFEKNLRLLLQFVSTPYFTPESVQKEQGIIGQEIRMYEDDPGTVVWEELMRCLYAHHPIRDSVVGTVESIAKITDKTLYDCHKVFYNPSNMCLAVVGDVDPELVRRTALEILPAEGGEKPGRDYGESETLLPCRERFQRAMEVSAPQFMLGLKLLPCAGKGDELLRQKLVAGLALNCLYSQSSPFYNRLYSEGLINTDFFTDLYHAAGTATVMAGGESRDAEKVLEEFCAEAEKTAKEGIAPDYFRRMKRAGYGARVRALSSFAGLCASMADGAFGDYNCLDSFAVSESITAEEVRAFIADNFRRERIAMSVITPPEAKEAAESC